jgi:hypothetical protein
MTLRSPSLTDNPLASPSSSGPPGSRAVLRCAGTADFLAVLPFLTGFTDENSLFVVLFRGVRGEDVIRIDLPAPDDRVAERALLTTLIEVLRVTGSGAESPAVVCATARSFEQCGGVPFLRLLRKIERRCVTEGWRLRELAVVASDGWAALLSADPLAQRNLDEIAASPLAVEASEHSHVQPLRLPNTSSSFTTSMRCAVEAGCARFTALRWAIRQIPRCPLGCWRLSEWRSLASQSTLKLSRKTPAYSPDSLRHASTRQAGSWSRSRY